MIAGFVFLSLGCHAQGWKQVYPQQTVRGTALLSRSTAGKIFRVSYQCEIYQSSDWGSTWESFFEPTTYFTLHRFTSDGFYIYVAPLEQPFYRLIRFNMQTGDTVSLLMPFSLDVPKEDISFDFTATEGCLSFLQPYDNGTKGLYVSPDRGMTWDYIKTSDSLSLLFGSLSFANPLTGILRCAKQSDKSVQKIFVTRNSGQDWQEVPEIAYNPLTLRPPMQWLSTSAAVLAFGSSLYATHDTGYTWQRMEPLPMEFYVNNTITDLSFIDTQHGVALGSEYDLYKTADGGYSWIRIHDPITVSNFDYDPMSRAVLAMDMKAIFTAGRFGYFFSTTDGGMNWIDHYGSSLTNIDFIHFYSKDKGICVAQDVFIPMRTTPFSFETVDGGKSWTKLFDFQTLGNVFSWRGSAIGDAALYVLRDRNPSAKQAVLRSIDRGKSWTQVKDFEKTDTLLGKNSSGTFLVSGRGADTIFIRVERGLLRSYDGGNSWQLLPDVLVGQVVDEDLISAMDMTSAKVGWMHSEMKLYRTTNDGDTWEVVFSSPGQSRRVGECNVFDDSSVQFISGYGSVIYSSTDGGATWVETTIKASGSNHFFFPSGTVFEILRSAINSSRNMLTDVALQYTLPKHAGVLRTGFFLDEQTGWVTGNNFFLHTSNGGISWASPPKPVPEFVSITGSYPNPVSPGSALSLDLELAGVHEQRISLMLYDTMGRKITTLREGAVAPGRTSVSFPTTGLSPGLYFVRLVTERGTDVRKVVVR